MSMKINLIRPYDLLNLRVETINLRLDLNDPNSPTLTVDDPNRPAFLTVVFPTQSIIETAYFENSVVPSAQNPSQNVPIQPGVDATKTDPQTKRALAEANKTTNEPLDSPGVIGPKRKAVAKPATPSRLVFKVPLTVKIPYTIQGLLDWSDLDLQVNPIAAIGANPTKEQIANAPPIQAPKQTETALELPYQLLISPTSEVAWNHRKEPFTANGRTELWHTRLQLKTENGTTDLSRNNQASLRAIWSNYPNYNPSVRPANVFAPDPDLGRTAMSTDDRWQIVILTSAFHGYESKITFNFPFIPILASLNTTEEMAFSESGETFAESSEITLGTRISPAAVQFGRAAGRYSFMAPYVPKPFYTEQLILSPLGGWLRSRGNWTPPKKIKQPSLQAVPNLDRIALALGRGSNLFSMTEAATSIFAADISAEAVTTLSAAVVSAQQSSSPQLDLSEWVHVATQGRDHYVRIVYEGELWPFRHKAALIKVTERKFMESAGIVGAYLMQRMFIVVREPEKQFAERASPFRMVRLTTTVTPDIADPKVIADTTRSFWVEVTTTASPRELFQFHAVGKDWANNMVDLTIPLMFVSISDLPDAAPAKAKLVMKAYNAGEKIDARSATLFGNKVVYAEQATAPAEKNDNTQLVTETLNFVVDQWGNPAKMLFATVKIPQVQDLLGKDEATAISYFKNFVDGGFDSVNGVFAQIISKNFAQPFPADNPFSGLNLETYGLNFTSDKAGGFATPNMNISTLTRKLGPVAGNATDALTDTFNPSQFFQGVTAQIFGAFDLINLLMPTGLGKNAPHLQTKTEELAGGKLIQAIMDWNPEVQDVDLGVVSFLSHGKNGSKSKLAVHGVAKKTVNLDSVVSSPTFDLNGKLTDFIVSILDCVTINFTEFSFDSLDGKKPNVDVKLDPSTPIEFGGDLAFVEELRKAIPPDLFGSGPSLDISPTGIKAGFAFALPPISVGVFSLKDVSLGAAVTLPFLDGKPTFDFNVSEREHPFLLTVYFFGGGGFFRLQLDTLGMKELEAALEFGAAASLDIGVASGEVHIMAGIYFSLQRKENSLEFSAVLTGYMRLGGSLNVLGLIHISVEFNLSFTYDSDRDKAYGRATLTVEVEVLFFSASVELTVERAFGGSGDPHFEELFTKPEMWNEYALAFA